MNWCDRCTCTSHAANGCSCPCHPREEGTTFRIMSPEELKTEHVEVFRFCYMPRPTGMHVEWWLYGKMVDRAAAVDFFGEEYVAKMEKQAADDFKKYMEKVA